MALMDRYLRLFCIFQNILHASRGGLSESAISNMSLLYYPVVTEQIPAYIALLQSYRHALESDRVLKRKIRSQMRNAKISGNRSRERARRV
jgi:hypothetical protein